MVSRPRPDQPERQIWRLLERIDRLETMVYGRSSSVTNGRTRFAGNESILVEGSGKVEGWWIVTGTQRVTGRLEGSGTFDWTGPWFLRGAGQVTGNLSLKGNTTLDGDLSLGSGRFIAGPVTIDRLGPAGGRIRSSGQMIIDGSSIYLGASTTVEGPLGVNGSINASGDIYAPTKSFLIPHPSRPGKMLHHGSLEGPEHGVYYRGRVTFDAAGEAVFNLPDYYVPLVADEAPTVLVTPVGRPFPVGADEVVKGRVTVYGDTSRSAHVLVMAARGTFDVEPDASAYPLNSGQ